METFTYYIVSSQNACRFREAKTHRSVRVRYICEWHGGCKRLCAVTHIFVICTLFIMDIIWALYTLYMHIHVWIEALMKISIR